jgi:hypothetical protein
MNPILLQSYQLGVIIGVILLSTLILFPGTNQNDDTLATAPVEPVSASLSKNTTITGTDTSEKGSIDRSSGISNDVDTPNFLSPHRRLNWLVYLLIYIVMTVIIFYSYNSTIENQDALPLYRRQLQNPTKLLQLTLEAYFPKEASLLFSKPEKRRTDQESS